MRILTNLTFLALAGILSLSLVEARSQWTIDQANQWRDKIDWFAGCNFVPSTAVNVLEMWQAETFDLLTVDRELGYAQSIGFTVIRVFLHPLVWHHDPAGFKGRMEKFLEVADSHKIKTMFVLFDDCWKPEGYLGPQPDPIPGVHNSQWVQSPGNSEYVNSTLYPTYKVYFLDIIGQFRDDPRILLWDIYNEPGNSAHVSATLPLLRNAFLWARQANPSQPISAGVWNWDVQFTELNLYQTSNSDVITYHIYGDVAKTTQTIQNMMVYGRPTICTEYMARPLGSNFITHIPLFRKDNVPAINWGLVNGRTNTIYPWWSKEGDPAPKIWFHDVLHKNGTAFDA